MATSQAVALCKRNRELMLLVENLIVEADLHAAMANRDARTSHNPGRAVVGRGVKAVRAAKEAVSVAKRSGDKSLLGTANFQLAGMQHMVGRLDEALRAAARAAALFRGSAVRGGGSEAVSTCLMGEIHLSAGNSEEATEFARRALGLAEAARDQRSVARARELLERIEMAGELPGRQEATAFSPLAVASEAPGSSAQLASHRSLGFEEVIATVTSMVKANASAEDIDLDSPLMVSGFDSLTAVAFRNMLMTKLEVNLPASLLFDYPTQRAVATNIVARSWD